MELQVYEFEWQSCDILLWKLVLIGIVNFGWYIWHGVKRCSICKIDAVLKQMLHSLHTMGSILEK